MERVYAGPLLEVLGIRPGMRVALIGIDDAAIRPLLAERTSDVTEGLPRPDTDVVLLGADSTDSLAPLESIARRIPTPRCASSSRSRDDRGDARVAAGHPRCTIRPCPICLSS